MCMYCGHVVMIIEGYYYVLSIAGEILTRVLFHRLSIHVHHQNVLTESQCGFRAGRGTADMIFAA